MGFAPGNKFGRGRQKGSKNVLTPAKEALKGWETGSLSYKLKDNQKLIYDTLGLTQARKIVLHCSRRFGKSFLLAAIAVEAALKTPGIQVSFICPTQKNLKTILKPIFNEIFKDCPDELRPEYRAQDAFWIFPNRSEIHLFGVEGGNIENLRGQSTWLALVDEAGFIDNLRYVVDSVLIPQLLTTNGRLILSSSSPLSKDHEFVHYINEAKISHSYHKFTIDQAGYDPKLVIEFALEAGGRGSTVFRREYLCELVTEEKRALCPEWKEEYVFDYPRNENLFKFYLKWFSMDTGVRDLTVGLFAYYDFKEAKLIIEDEFMLTGQDARTDVIAGQIRLKEAALEYQDVSRYGDNDNLILLQDLTAYHDLPVMSVSKDSLEAMVNQVRLWVAQGRIIINPRCALLITTLENGLWNKHRTDFHRSETLGHMDAFAALMYMVRTVATEINPIPPYLGANPSTHMLDHEARKRDAQNDAWKNALNLKEDNEDNN